MLQTIKINGIEAKGRNGYFKADSAQLWNSTFEEAYNVEVYSKRIGDAPPIKFTGNKLNLILFFESIVNGLKADKGK